jgi:hypothetical protein
MSAFYPGASTDIVPPVLFRSIKNWLYMDSQPNSEFGEGVYKTRFIPTLLTIMLQNEFELKAINGDTYTFYNRDHDQTINYEMNTLFPDDLKEKHLECETLVLIGYPVKNMSLNFISSYSHIITDSLSRPDPAEQSLLLFKNVSLLWIDNQFMYREPSHCTTKNIIKNIGIINPRVKSKQIHI